jgi:hypothetical protein
MLGGMHNSHESEAKEKAQHDLLSELDVEFQHYRYGKQQNPEVRDDVDGGGCVVVRFAIDAIARLELKVPVFLNRDTGEGGDHECNKVPDYHEAERPFDHESKIVRDEDAVVEKKDGVLGEQDSPDIKDVGDVDGLGYSRQLHSTAVAASR